MADTVVEAKSESGLVDHGKHSWQGVAFSLCGQRMVARLGEVVEVLTVPEFTKVHNAEPWLIGIANIRSQLVTLIDLETYFGSSSSGNKKNLRVLIVEDGFSKVGLVVSKVYGLKSFSDEEFIDFDNESQGPLATCVDAIVENNQSEKPNTHKWSRFSIEKLLSSAHLSTAAC